MSLKPPSNHEIPYANSQSWWFKIEFDGQTPFLQYHTLQSGYLTEPWKKNPFNWIYDNMLIFHSKLWNDQRLSLSLPFPSSPILPVQDVATIQGSPNAFFLVEVKQPLLKTYEWKSLGMMTATQLNGNIKSNWMEKIENWCSKPPSRYHF